MARPRKSKADATLDALPALERIAGRPLTFGAMLESYREGEGLTLEAFAKKLGISRANLCDIEQGRKGVAPARAARWAGVLGFPSSSFVALALQHALDRAGLKLIVEVRPRPLKTWAEIKAATLSPEQIRRSRERADRALRKLKA